MIIYSKGSGYTSAAIGRLETPIKMIIEHESDLLKKKGGVCDWLFNVEKSNRFGETIVGQNEFSMFADVAEGAAAPQDTVKESYRKFIEHIQFMKEFVISAEMMEDANFGVAADAKRRVQNFTRAYYQTINTLCEQALIMGVTELHQLDNTDIDLRTGDGMPLFSCAHYWGKGTGKQGTQSNYFFGDFYNESSTPTTAGFEEMLSVASMKLRNMKDENGKACGYTADTLIIPGNRPAFEAVVKKVCGTLGATGGNFNDINLHFGNWNVIILPNWSVSEDRFMVMSSEANRALAGNMFFNRVPLTVTHWVDHHTGNYIWNGRCRFGIGFGNYKHIAQFVNSVDDIEGASGL